MTTYVSFKERLVVLGNGMAATRTVEKPRATSQRLSVSVEALAGFAPEHKQALRPVEPIRRSGEGSHGEHRNGS